MVLDINRAQRFDELNEIVVRGKKAFLETGRALMEIRDQDLWAERGFESFEGYLRSHDLDRRYAYNMIDAHSIAVSIAHNDGVPPNSEGQVRALAALKDQPERMIQAWNLAQERASFKDRPTGAEVRKAVEEILGGKPEAPEGKAELPWLGDRFDKLVYEIDWWRTRATAGTDHGYWSRIREYVNR